MKNILLTTIFCFFAVTIAYGQPEVLWTKTFGGIGAERGNSIALTTDNGFIICGYTYSEGVGFADVYLLKTDASGNEEWSNTYGGSGWDYGHSVQQTSDGGFIITGYTSSFGAGSHDVYLIKTDASGDIQWTNTIGGTGVDVGNSVIETDNGEFMICGYTESFGAGEDDLYLIKTSSVGDTVWTKTFGAERSELGNCIIQTDDGGFMLGGSVSSPSLGMDPLGAAGRGLNYNFYLIKLDANGDEEWWNHYGEATFPPTAHCKSIVQTRDGGYIAMGDDNVVLPMVLKIDSQGNEQWVNANAMGFLDYGNDVIQGRDGGYVTCGVTKIAAEGGQSTIRIEKLVSDGQSGWEMEIEDSAPLWGTSICEAGDGNYVIIGQINSDGVNSRDIWMGKISNPLMVSFQAEYNTGHAPFQVNFQDESFGNLTSWQWDFDNDGTIDSQERYPTWMYDQPGTYTVKLDVSDGVESQTLILEDYINVFSDGESALNFDAQDGLVNCGNDQSLNLTEAITIEAWINPSGWGESGAAGYGRIVDKNKFRLALLGEGGNFNDQCLNFQIFQQAGPPSFSFTPDNSILLHGWKHIAVTYSPATGVKMYINGVSQDITQTAPPTGNIANNSDFDCIIGNSSDGSFSFDGTIDDVRIWNVVRTDSEIQENMNQLLNGDETGLVGYWNMNEGNGNFVTDLTNNGNQGALNASVWVQGTPFTPTSIKDVSFTNSPSKTLISGNYPNPFNPTTTIFYDLPQNTNVNLSIYDISGKLIKNLVDKEMEPGYHSIAWDGKDDGENDVSSGIYIYRVNAGSCHESKSILLLK